MLFISKSSFHKSVSRFLKKILCRFQVREVESQASVWTAQSYVQTPISVQKFLTVQGCIRPDIAATRPDAHQCLTRNQISFSNTDMGRQLHMSGHQVYTVWTLSLIRQDVEKNCNCSDIEATSSGCDPYYGIYVQHIYNCPDVRATPSERGPDMVLCEALYGKPVAQLSARTASNCVRTPPRENWMCQFRSFVVYK
jgi:hypothetical protein